MNFYQEITLIGQAEISSYFIWSKLYAQLHLALVGIKDKNNNVDVGVSFPQYTYEKGEEGVIIMLGDKLRIFCEIEETLQNLNMVKWLERFSDYLYISSILTVPQNRVMTYVSFSRKQVKTNAERLARHRIKTRNDIDYNEAINLYKNRVATIDLPFIQMKSLTNGQPFRLFIEKRISERSSDHKFNTYGLSAESTVPDF